MLAGPGAHERALADLLLARLPDAIDLTGRLSLPEAAACLARADLFVGNDSGLMHLAAASGVPTLGLFGPTSAAEYGPAGRQTAFVCSPSADMADLLLPEVARAAEALLGAMMRVAQVMAGAAHGGAELFFERLCVAMRGQGDAVLPVIRRNPARAALLRDAGMTPLELAFGPPIDLLTRWRLKRGLDRFAPLVAISWMNRATLHMPRGPWKHVGRLGGYYPLRHYRHCDHLIGNTRGIVDWLRREGWPVSRTHYLPNFTHDFAATPPATDLPKDGKLLLGLGRLHADKGFDTLLQALALLPDCRLAIAGDGPERARLEALAVKLGVAERARFLGWRDDAGALLRAADAFVCSSRVEPLGNMVIEAWSAGTPVIACAARGPAELLHDGQDGRLVPIDDPRALAEAIRQVLESHGQQADLAAAGRKRFDAAFAAPTVLASWRELLADIAPG